VRGPDDDVPVLARRFGAGWRINRKWSCDARDMRLMVFSIVRGRGIPRSSSPGGPARGRMRSPASWRTALPHATKPKCNLFWRASDSASRVEWRCAGGRDDLSSSPGRSVTPPRFPCQSGRHRHHTPCWTSRVRAGRPKASVTGMCSFGTRKGQVAGGGFQRPSTALMVRVHCPYSTTRVGGGKGLDTRDSRSGRVAHAATVRINDSAIAAFRRDLLQQPTRWGWLPRRHEGWRER